MNNAELLDLIRPLIMHAYSENDVQNVLVQAATDHDGDPVIKIEIELGNASKPPRPEITFALTKQIITALSERDDDRFPLIFTRFQTDEPGEDFYPNVPARKAGSR